MDDNRAIWAEVDAQGRLVMPPEMVERFGLVPGARLRVQDLANNLRLHRPVSQLAKVYIEPTNRCNITCVTCMRNIWDEPLGKMSRATFEHILDGLQQITPRPLVFFGGIGEPLFHTKTIEMIERVRAIGAPVEIITNAILLNAERSKRLIDAGIETLWVSIDGARPESYEDVRLGAELPRVLENLQTFRSLRHHSFRPMPEIGINFVAMKRNIHDLPEVLKIAASVGARRFMVSNILPYDREMNKETLYTGALNNIAYLPSKWLPRLSIPKMDLNDLTREPFFRAITSGWNVTFAGNNFGGSNDVCNFIESGAMAIGWDGGVAPCIPLLHTHTTFLRKRERLLKRHIIGKVGEKSLLALWNDPGYVAYRERVHSFAFAPCSFCGGCDLLDSNEEDCIGNKFPVCGGCLWAQALIQCP
ncbi:MAG: SPASM domain-containing protein [Chloroflexi bacterium]|nr:SPASM domain-containing protein [Chloroflexota bacterium]